jgi:hypothetical protein
VYILVVEGEKERKVVRLVSLALLIFASFGIAQTSLALHSFIAKIWFVLLVFVRLSNVYDCVLIIIHCAICAINVQFKKHFFFLYWPIRPIIGQLI